MNWDNLIATLNVFNLLFQGLAPPGSGNVFLEASFSPDSQYVLSGTIVWMLPIIGLFP